MIRLFLDEPCESISMADKLIGSEGDFARSVTSVAVSEPPASKSTWSGSTSGGFAPLVLLVLAVLSDVVRQPWTGLYTGA